MNALNRLAGYKFENPLPQHAHRPPTAVQVSYVRGAIEEAGPIPEGMDAEGSLRDLMSSINLLMRSLATLQAMTRRSEKYFVPEFNLRRSVNFCRVMCYHFTADGVRASSGHPRSLKPLNVRILTFVHGSLTGIRRFEMMRRLGWTSSSDCSRLEFYLFENEFAAKWASSS